MSNLKSIRAITIACWVLTAAVLIGLTVWVLTSGMSFGGRNVFLGVNISSRPFEVVGSRSVSAQGVRDMHIDWIAGRVEIRPWDGSEIQITEFSDRELREGETLRLNTQDGTVRIDFWENRAPRGNVAPKDLEVLIPRGLSSDLESFTINGMAARVTVSDIAATTFAAETVSGRINLAGITSERLDAGTMSGRVELFEVSANQANLSSVSGRIELARTQIPRLDVNTVSGRHELSGAFEHLSLESVSGRIEVTSTALPADLRANTVSGRISLTVPNEGEISVRHSSASGRFSSEIPVIMHGSDAQFRLSTTSGRVNIYALR